MLPRLPVIVSACAMLLTTACYNHPEVPKCGEPLYGGVATEETWHTMLYALKQPMDTSLAATVLSPAEGTTFATHAPRPRFSWSSPLRSALEHDTPSRLAEARPLPPRNPLGWLGELLVPTAEAHNSMPYTGDIYLVQITTPGRECPIIEVLTSEVFWQVDKTSWETLGEAAGQELFIQVTSAFLQFNRLKEGPYRSESPRLFRLQAPAQ